MFKINTLLQKIFILTTLVILILLTMIAAFFSYTPKDRSAQIPLTCTPPPTTETSWFQPAFVASQPLGRGYEFVPGSVGVKYYPDGGARDMIADEVEVVGKVAKTEIAQGQVVVRSMLVDAAEWKRTCTRQIYDVVVCFRPDERYFYGIHTWHPWTIALEGTMYDTLAMTEEMIYFWRNDQLYAIDVRTGEQVWTFKDQAVKDIVSSATPVVFDETLLFWSYSNKHLYALNQKTGEEKWRYEAEGLLTYPTMIADGVVSVSSSDGYMYALDLQQGQELWQTEQ